MDGITQHLLIFSSLAYLIGSIPFGLLLSKLFLDVDIRTIGSGNIGATNVLRSGNKLLAFATLLLDSGKGAIVIVVSYLVYAFNNVYALNAPDLSHPDSLLSYAELSACIGFFAILGHCFPIWLKFKGGKGVATALGTLLAAVPYAGLAACAAWIITAKVSKISSLSALIAVAVAPIVTAFIYGFAPATICALITILVWIRHKDNIKRLLKGEEPKIGQDKKEKPEHTQKGDKN
ncbi:MAG: glycerol-3-phosphate 1-O-acyltransferase PlsY [Alphaproteobacteria bacterium]